MKNFNPILSYSLLFSVALTAAYFIYFYHKVEADASIGFNQIKATRIIIE